MEAMFQQPSINEATFPVLNAAFSSFLLDVEIITPEFIISM
jgi:hypothetical protein